MKPERWSMRGAMNSDRISIVVESSDPLAVSLAVNHGPGHVADVFTPEVGVVEMLNPSEQLWRAFIIAAAPELLDVLTLALPYVESAESDPTYKPGAVKKMAAQMRAAIEKAGGRAKPLPTWIIVDGGLAWNNETGWGDLASATVFTDAERKTARLPLSGLWQEVRP